MSLLGLLHRRSPLRTPLLVALALSGTAAHAEPLLGLLARDNAQQSALVRFDSTKPSVITARMLVTGLPTGDHLVAVDLRPTTGQVHGLSAQGGLYVLDTSNGAATLAGKLSVPIDGNFVFGMDFDPVADMAGRPSLRLTNNNGQNLRVDVRPGSVGATTVLPRLELSDGGSVFGTAYSRNDLNPKTTSGLHHIGTSLEKNDLRAYFLTLYRQLDQSSGAVARVNATRQRSANGTWGFDISSSGTAFASITNYAPSVGPPLPAASSLYVIDLASGTARRLGAIGTSRADLVLDITALTPPRRYASLPLRRPD